MKIRTSELTGAALDWAVAKADGLRVMDGWQGRWEDSGFTDDWFLCPRAKAIIMMEFDGAASRAGMWRECARFSPSTNWSQSGPIIGRENIQWCQLNGAIEAWLGFDYIQWRVDWDSDIRMPAGAGFGVGGTVLTAAMRCYVSSKLGDEVDVPEELT